MLTDYADKKITRIRLFFFYSLFTIHYSLFLMGCATVPDIKQPTVMHPLPLEPGIYHEVHRGETLWRISKVYEIDMQRIVDVNRLPNAAKIETGQLIFIPGAAKKIDLADANFAQYEKDTFIWPAEGKVISFFGTKKNNGSINKGIDIQTEPDSNILASKSGVVLFASDKVKGFGNTIILDHEDGFLTLYANNSLNLVRPAQRVKQGQIIAKAGTTGRANTPMLHFQIRKAHKSQNPFYFLP